MNTHEQHYAQVRYSIILQSKQMLTADIRCLFTASWYTLNL